MISLVTMMRDSAAYVDVFFEQVTWLRDDYDVEVVIVEGDSTDDTYARIEPHLAPGDQLLKLDTGGPYFRSEDREDRWRQLAKVGNYALDSARKGEPRAWIESDLIWDNLTLRTLIEDLERVPAVAPLVTRHGVFYETWGHRGEDGARFRSTKPHHPAIVNDFDLVPLSSAGSCVVMRADVGDVARMGDTDCIVGLGRNIYEAGGSLWLDPRCTIFHP